MVSYLYYLKEKRVYLDKHIYEELCRLNVSPVELDSERAKLVMIGHPKPNFNTAASIIIARRRKGDFS